jgi:capsular polysaccharide transport system ATP-binding protein
MIRLEGLTKIYHTRGLRKLVADSITIDFPSGIGIGLLGRNGAGKSTLLKMIAGTVDPTAGKIVHDGTVSWPVGFGGSFHPDLTGLQNVRFVARVYGVDTTSLCRFVEDFAELGDHFYLPTRNYSSGMKARLSFGVSMGIRFDTYLVDETTNVGDAVFREKSEAIFQERIGNSSAIMVSHGAAMLRRNCTSGAVLEHGKLYWFDEIDEAIAFHESNMGAATLEDDDA